MKTITTRCFNLLIFSTVPDVPTITSLTAINTTLNVIWSSAGPDVNYEVVWRTGAMEDSHTVSDGSNCFTITGLVAETMYAVFVRAQNEADSTQSQSMSARIGQSL